MSKKKDKGSGDTLLTEIPEELLIRQLNVYDKDNPQLIVDNTKYAYDPFLHPFSLYGTLCPLPNKSWYDRLFGY